MAGLFRLSYILLLCDLSISAAHNGAHSCVFFMFYLTKYSLAPSMHRPTSSQSALGFQFKLSFSVPNDSSFICLQVKILGHSFLHSTLFVFDRWLDMTGQCISPNLHSPLQKCLFVLSSLRPLNHSVHCGELNVPSTDLDCCSRVCNLPKFGSADCSLQRERRRNEAPDEHMWADAAEGDTIKSRWWLQRHRWWIFISRPHGCASLLNDIIHQRPDVFFATLKAAAAPSIRRPVDRNFPLPSASRFHFTRL